LATEVSRQPVYPFFKSRAVSCWLPTFWETFSIPFQRAITSTA
jgi:hypothetical protein